jgi:voltage-gated potassium channel
MEEARITFRRLRRAIAIFAAVLLVGTIGFHLILDDGWVAALYRSIVTTTLTGLDTPPAGSWAKLFTAALLFAGVAIFLFIAGAIVEVIARGILTGAYTERRKRRLIDQMRDHTIICGYGRVGRRVAAEFRAHGRQYVIIEFNETSLAVAVEQGEAVVIGNGTNDTALAEAGLARARSLVASSDSDVDNLYITLSARSARPDLLIIARASTEDAANKLRLAGADRVVQPYTSAGRTIANLVLKPQVAAFVDSVTSAEEDFRFEEIEVIASSGRAGKSIRELRIRSVTGAIVIAIRKRDGSLDTTPSPDAVLEEGDIIVAAGSSDELERLEELFAPRQDALA